MYRICKVAATLATLASLSSSAYAVILIDETFDPVYTRLTQDIANGNMAVYKSRSATTATVGVSDLAFSGPGTSSGADQYFSYFTDPGATFGPYVQNGKVVLGVGDKLSVSLTFKLGAMPADTSTYSLRFGIFDENTGSRQTSDFTGGVGGTAFTDDLAYSLHSFPMSSVGAANAFNFRYRSAFTTANVFSAAADWTSIGANSGGTYTGLASDTYYIFNYSIFRQDATTTVLSSAILSADGSTTLNSGSATQLGVPTATSFSWFGWRLPGNTITTTFDKMLVEVITVPEPSALTLVGMASVLGWFIRRKRV